MNEPNNQEINRGSDGRWKKGKSGNPLGRPKGKTMKEWARDYLSKMTDEERDEFMDGLSKDIIWRMAEGNPHSTEDTKVEVTLPTPLLNGLYNNHGNKEDSETPKEN